MQSAGAYKTKAGDQIRRGDKSPSTAASGQSLGQGTTIRLKQRNHSLNVGGGSNPRIRTRFNPNRTEYNAGKLLSKSSLMRENEDLVTDDVEGRLNQLGVTLTPQVSRQINYTINLGPEQIPEAEAVAGRSAAPVAAAARAGNPIEQQQLEWLRRNDWD